MWRLTAGIHASEPRRFRRLFYMILGYILSVFYIFHLQAIYSINILLLLYYKYKWTLKYPPGLICRLSSGGITRNDIFNSDNMLALTSKLNLQFVVSYYRELNFECIDTKWSMSTVHSDNITLTPQCCRIFSLWNGPSCRETWRCDGW